MAFAAHNSDVKSLHNIAHFAEARSTRFQFWNALSAVPAHHPHRRDFVLIDAPCPEIYTVLIALPNVTT